MNSTRETSPPRSILPLFVMLVLLSVPSWAQQEAAILGQVTDDTGGVLPGVTVMATSPALAGIDVDVTPNLGLRLQGDYRVIRTEGHDGKASRVLAGVVWRQGRLP